MIEIETPEVCPVCNIDGDLGDEQSYLIEIHHDLGALGTLETTGYILRNRDKDNAPSICLENSIVSKDATYIDIGASYIPINYCPACGRKLI